MSKYSARSKGYSDTSKIIVVFYDVAGNEIKREEFNSGDLTEYEISFDETTEITKIEITNVHNWNVSLCVNIWEAQVISGIARSAE